jgi:C4-dicarboxylate-specific signal transduction histidine kinase
VVGLSLLLLLPLSAGVLWSANQTRLERQAEVRAEAVSVATTAAAYLDEYLNGLDALASSLVRHPAVLSLDTPACDRLFGDLLREHRVLTNLLLAGPDGTIRGSALNQGDGRTTRAWLGRVLASRKPEVGELGTGTVSGKPTITLAYPVFAAGRVAGVLALTIDLTRLQTVFTDVSLPPGTIITVSDRDRRTLVHSGDPRLVGQVSNLTTWPDAPRSELRVGVDGVDRLYGDAALHRAPWLLSVGVPRTVVADRLRPLWRRNSAIVLSTVMLSLLFAMWLARLMSRQLNHLRSAARRIADGDLSPPVAAAMPNLELAQLQDAFVVMAANLRAAREALDRQVEQERRMNETLQSLQRQVVRQERLAAVGVLVSGVAHELNNPLQAILGTAEILERTAGIETGVLRELSFVKTQSGRACEIIRSLSRFSRPQTGAAALVSLDDVIAEVVRMRQADLTGAGVALDVRVSSCRPVYANFTELQQVTLNFAMNAQQALESAATPSRRMTITLFDCGANVRLEVSDNGPGVRPEDEPKLFQPFFTTKPVGKGTGLGLSVSYGIVESYGGTIGYAPNDWGGATFFFELPAAKMSDAAIHDPSHLLRRPV